MKKFKFLSFFVMQKNDSRFKFSKAFSLIELMISLIVISLVAAAFAPVITKKLSSSSIFAGSIGGGFSKSCSNISEDCALCAGDTCLSCKNKCDEGEILNVSDCSCKVDTSYYVKIDGLLVTKYNMGDHNFKQIPSSAGVSVVNVANTSETCSSSSQKCCWQGETSRTSCDGLNGRYSGCKRTVCNWAAANEFFENY